VSSYLELSFDLAARDPQAAEEACFTCGATAITFVDAHDDPVLEPLPGEFRLWPATRIRCLFGDRPDPQTLRQTLAASLALEPDAIAMERLPERAWEREWLKDFHAMRFGKRLWVCPHHETVRAADAVVVALDPGLAFGSGTHPSTALCLTWLDAHLTPGTRVIDYGCGSGVLGLAAAKLGALEVHGFDIDPQALLATRGNARANSIADRVHVHEQLTTLPGGADVLVANILSAPLCELAPAFAALLKPRGTVVLAGLMEHEVVEVTAAYAPWFHVSGFGLRDGWACLTGTRH
jgi:ribosomal protein L11 methyltransferase